MNEYHPEDQLNLQKLAVFVQLARTKSFSKAGVECGLTQSAVSRSIKDLESSIGAKLVERSTRSFSLTQAGSYLLEKSQQLFDTAIDIKKKTQGLSGKVPNVIKLGVANSIGNAYFPGFVAIHQRKHPETKIEVKQTTDKQLMELLMNEEIQMAIFGEKQRRQPSIKSYRIFSDPFVFITPKDNTKSNVIIDHINQHSMLSFSTEYPLGEKLKSWIYKMGFTKKIDMEFDNFDVIINMVMSGIGCAFVPKRALPLYANKRNFFVMNLPESFNRQIEILSNAKKNSIIDNFMSCLSFRDSRHLG